MTSYRITRSFAHVSYNESQRQWTYFGDGF